MKMSETLHNCLLEIDKRSLKLLGVNSFGVVYADSNNVFHLIKLTQVKNKVDIEKISGFKRFGVAKHFISIGYNETPYFDTNMLFVKGSKANILGRFTSSTPRLISNDGSGSVLGMVSGDFELVCIEISQSNIHIINYAGKKINLSDYAERYYNINIDLAIVRDGDFYKIGYCEQNKENMIREGFYRSTRVNYPIIRTDKDFSSIVYLRYKTKGTKHI